MMYRYLLNCYGIIFLENVKERNGFATVENINKYNLREKI